MARDENLIDIETDKVVLELPAPANGVLVEILKSNGATVVSGELIARIDTTAQASVVASASKLQVTEAAPLTRPNAATSPPPSAPMAAGVALPAARKILDEKGVSPADVAGSGRGGRITKEDARSANAP